MHGKVSAAAVSPTGHHILFQDECCKPQVSRFHTYQTLSTVDKAMQTDPMLMQNPHHSAKCMKMQLMQSPTGYSLELKVLEARTSKYWANNAGALVDTIMQTTAAVYCKHGGTTQHGHVTCSTG
jgi:hypothetical protein